MNRNYYKICKNSGFSLLEISIVLVVISFIAASVVGGMQLSNSAKLRVVIAEMQEYNSFVMSFKEKFKYYPGDIPVATKYWSGSDNGNGDWLIGSDDIEDDENYLAFSHLSLAGFTSDYFTGEIESSGAESKIGVNVPRSSYGTGSTYYFYSSDHWDNYKDGNALILSGATTNLGWDDYQVKIKDAYYIDNKIDDSMPYTGALITYSNVDGDCVDASSRLSDSPASLSAVNYNLTDASNLCTIAYGLDGYIYVD